MGWGGMVLVTGKVTALEHELGDYAVEGAALVSLSSVHVSQKGMYKSVLAGTQFTEILGRPGNLFVIQLATRTISIYSCFGPCEHVKWGGYYKTILPKD